MSAGRIFYSLLAALIAGIAAGSFVSDMSTWFVVPAVLFGVCFLKLKKVVFCLIMGVVCAAGFFFVHQEIVLIRQTHNALTQRLPFELVGTIEDLQINERDTTFIVESDGARVRVRAFQKDLFEHSFVRVICTTLDNDPYLPLYVSKNIDAECHDAEIFIEQATQSRDVLEQVRTFLLQSIYKAIPSPESELLQGLLLGKQATLPSYLEEALRKTGTTHIVVLSGFNITVIAFVFHGFFRRLRIPLWQITCWSIVAIWLFVFLAGSSPPTVRAALMVTCVLIAQGRGRRHVAAYALLLSAAIMLLHAPLLLRYGVSFQLSFLATAAVLYKDYLIPRLSFIPDYFSVRENVRTTLAATLATLPLQIFTFGTASSIGVVINALILPLIPLAMALGVVVLMFSFFSSQAALVAGVPAFVVLRLMTLVIEGGANIPFAFFALPAYASLACFVFLAVLVVWARIHKTNQIPTLPTTYPKKYLWIGCTFGIAGCAMLVWLMQPKHPSVFFFDVGQGDAILIQDAGGIDVVIDAGPDDSIVSHLSRTMGYMDRTIELFILTHPHSDHLRGFFSLAEKYSIKEVWMTDAPYDSSLFDSFLALTEEQHIPVRFILQGEQSVSGISVTVLWPPEQLSDKNVNNTSVVMNVHFHGTNFLLMGDAETPVEEKLLQASTNDLAADILKVGHQGSSDASSEQFLSAVSPDAAIISVGEGNSFGHPHEEVLERIGRYTQQIVRTDVCGTVKVVPGDNAKFVSLCHP